MEKSRSIHSGNHTLPLNDSEALFNNQNPRVNTNENINDPQIALRVKEYNTAEFRTFDYSE